jgi:transcriptional regulator with XRE-family HTH domain
MKQHKAKIAAFSLSDRLVYLRQRRNLTQIELAKAANISQSTIAQLESGKKEPSLSTLTKLAKALDVHIAIFFSSDDVHVFDMNRLRKKYDHIDKLNPTIYHALGRVVDYAREIGFIK